MMISILENMSFISAIIWPKQTELANLLNNMDNNDFFFHSYPIFTSQSDTVYYVIWKLFQTGWFL